MKLHTLLGGAAALLIAMPAWADIVITDAYARSAMASAKTGAAFMVIENTGDEDDRLIGAASDAAPMVQLHTHIADANGVVKMRHVEDGFVIPAGGTHVLERGADHVMFMGLAGGFAEGPTVTVTLTFEKAGDITIDVPVQLDR
ncbi:copper chaperone PCu(A)C [Aestuariicoccus sp. MJ-SS9]|uniref:copper chaperone PCu(A)C n=1 Tax=Aestuariicoccus sp. MJ-SS9 TaxID=3079855 RepID=UPI0029115791|nr:copper chaperone PCu(A)C [Aestuariicoccus sp. MJ-SS9]MDU8909951.1 copper chaperone PCu(A)C [Aestuariicoccus sp. MJ-SS9]